MRRSNIRLLAVMILLVGAALARLSPAVVAQVLPDPGFGDPYAAGGYGDGQLGQPRPGGMAIGVPQLPINAGPSGPAFPTNASRPASWPGGSADPSRPAPVAAPPMSVPPATTAAPSKPRKSPAEPPYDPAEIVAHVGTEVVQASEVLLMVNQQIALIETQHQAELSQLTKVDREEQLNTARREMMKRAIDEIVKVKLLLTELHKKVPAEGLGKHEKMIREYFNSHEIKRLMEEHKALSVPDLETKLRRYGTSLDSQRTVFVERQMAGSWITEQTKKDPTPPTHEQMLKYYQEHVAKWDSLARVRWEQISVKFQNFDSKQAAFQSLARWGNELMRGAPFASVAKAHSQEVAAEEGGVHEWTNQGSLRSTTLDAALFSLPIGTLSRIIEDEDGFHIVRVLQREPAQRAAFTEVQKEIKQALQDGGKDKRQGEYLAKLQREVPVSTIFDEDYLARTTAPAGTVVR
ncbi:MAG TPA: peptidyl-prolyl cis-trans isomerase [Pirellulales bacterium]|nr:peptidyl-prolyl cis-trans isomerase [Pirellulales bacterium]